MTTIAFWSIVFFATGSILFVIGLLALRALSWFFETIPEEPVEIRPMDNTRLMRVVQTMPGDGLVAGIERAMLLAKEHGPICLIHLGVPVTVQADDRPYEHATRWRATARLYERREVCNGT